MTSTNSLNIKHKTKANLEEKISRLEKQISVLSDELCLIRKQFDSVVVFEYSKSGLSGNGWVFTSDTISTANGHDFFDKYGKMYSMSEMIEKFPSLSTDWNNIHPGFEAVAEKLKSWKPGEKFKPVYQNLNYEKGIY